MLGSIPFSSAAAASSSSSPNLGPMLLHSPTPCCSLTLHRSSHLGLSLPPHPLSQASPPLRLPHLHVRSEKVDFWQLLGGRGLPGGEENLKDDQKQEILFVEASPSSPNIESVENASPNEANDDAARGQQTVASVAGAFEKEMMGLTGGFPGGEKGLQKFLAENPPPLKPSGGISKLRQQMPLPGVKPRAPPPPLLMPGMTVIVKNPQHPYHMYSGIVQRVTDGRAGVLFEGGNWDKLLTFYLEDLERTSQGPPMSHPKSAVLEKTGIS